MPERAIVALSDDRQWLVVLSADGYWHVQQWLLIDEMWLGKGSFVKDTGQDAREVLTAFLAQRSEQ